MYPKHHAILSGAATFLAALTLHVDPVMIPVWTVIGVGAGVLIDVDHAVLSMAVDGRWQDGLYWFRHPVRAVTQPDTFLADMEYDALVYHRLLSHLVVLLVVAVLVPVHVLFIPVVTGVAVHIAADVYWDVTQGNYTPRFTRQE